MKVYEIAGAMVDTLDIFLESEGSENDKENYEIVMEYLKEELSNKSSSLIKYIRNLEFESKIAKEEADRLQKINRLKSNKIESLKKYLINIMQHLEKKKIETSLGSYGLRKSSKVDVYDMSLLTKDFLRVKEDIQPDKEKITDYIKKNGEMAGAKIIENYSLQIK